MKPSTEIGVKICNQVLGHVGRERILAASRMHIAIPEFTSEEIY